jgi:K+-transporting ATPase ATPase A chain
MLIGRYWLAIAALAIAGSLALKKKVTVTSGTLPTHSPLFVFWLIAVIVIVGALSFLPALSLGPLVEQMMR